MRKNVSSIGSGVPANNYSMKYVLTTIFTVSSFYSPISGRGTKIFKESLQNNNSIRKRKYFKSSWERVFFLIQEISNFGSLRFYQNITEIFGIKLLKPWVVHSFSMVTLRCTDWTSQKQWKEVAQNSVQHFCNEQNVKVRKIVGYEVAACFPSTNKAQCDILYKLHFKNKEMASFICNQVLELIFFLLASIYQFSNGICHIPYGKLMHKEAFVSFKSSVNRVVIKF